MTPKWELLMDGTDTPVAWIDHRANSRFAICSLNTTGTLDDLVLDKETGLIWPRNAGIGGGAMNWLDANTTVRTTKIASRAGWRLPSVEELSSLVDARRSGPALPAGHPFLNVQHGAGVWAYWSCTNHENPGASAWFVNFTDGGVGLGSKGGNPPVLGFAWPVRGGSAGVNWNW